MAVVAIVGRPNVGKSALFNRVTEKPRAIVADVEGVTRDRLYETTTWNGCTLTVVDTGGIWADEPGSVLSMTRQQTEIAMAEADVIVMVVDGRVGITDQDHEVAALLRRSRKPVVVAVNKAENQPWLASEFYQLGLGEPIAVSAIHGQGIGDLLDEVVNLLATRAADQPSENDPSAMTRIAIAGRPNVGKSSLLNWMTGQPRTLVTPIAGTTRDVVDAPIVVDGEPYLILDTAGLRRPNRIEEHLEQKTVQRSLAAIRAADIVLLMLAADEGVLGQDQRIAGQIAQRFKAAVVVVNKSDLVRGTTRPLLHKVQEELKFMPYAPVLFTSVLTGWHLDQLWPTIRTVRQSWSLRVGTHVLNQVIEEAWHLNPPPTQKGRQLKIYYATQVGVRPPHFVLFVNDPELSHFSYERYLEHRLREAFGFQGSPIRLSLRARRRQ
jgi:GTP-binding protein